MNCARLNQVLDAWLDGELDAETSADIRRHVDHCPACAPLEADRLLLSQALRKSAPYHRAPAGLRSRILHAMADPGEPPPIRRRPSWLQAGALAVCAAATAAAVTYWSVHGPSEETLRDHVAASHVAALADAKRLIAIESGDRHAVKPWFQGKVDFAPPVKDLSDAGFVLVGGRVDHVGPRQAAAVVYRVRNHVINLFVWRAPSEVEDVTVAQTRGYSVVTWAGDGLRYAAISDVAAPDLQRFADLMR